jgi:hypothetical protein
MFGVTNETTTGLEALSQMRRDRRKRRVAEVEWFEALYRVYLTALVGGGAVLALSGMVKDTKLSASELANVTTHGPHVIGLVAALVVFLGIRSGANGGPVSVEEAEVRHVLLAPVPHDAVLRHPAIQRIRSMAFAGALAGGVAGELTSRRMVTGNMATWAIWCAVAGALIGSLFSISALLAHTLAIPRSACTAIAASLVGWQVAVTFGNTNIAGPFDTLGSIALWPLRFRAVDIVGIVVITILGVIAIVQVAHLSLEALARRSALVSQLKFAVTLQDIRTVVLLRRQLSQEHMRERPWFKVPKALRKNVVFGRGFRSLAHFPARRMLRMSLLVIAAALCEVWAYRGTSPAVVVSGLLLFVFGLDIIEPLSQEVDQPDRTDALPVDRGWLLSSSLFVPVVATLPFVVLGAVVAYLAEPHGATIAVAFIAGIPAALTGVAGATVNAVKGAPDPVSEANQGLYLPPEMSGMGTVIRAVFPPAIAILGSLPVLSATAAEKRNIDPVGATVRTAIGGLLLVTLVAMWVHQREPIRAWFRQMSQAGRTPISQKAAQ